MDGNGEAEPAERKVLKGNAAMIFFTVDMNALRSAMARKTVDDGFTVTELVLSSELAISRFELMYEITWNSDKQAFQCDSEYFTVMKLQNDLQNIIKQVLKEVTNNIVVFTVDFDKLKKAMATVEYFAATKDHCAYTRTPLLTEMMAIDLFKHKFHCEWDSNKQAFRINAEYLTVVTLNGTMPDVILSRCFE